MTDGEYWEVTHDLIKEVILIAIETYVDLQKSKYYVCAKSDDYAVMELSRFIFGKCKNSFAPEKLSTVYMVVKSVKQFKITTGNFFSDINKSFP